MFDRGKDGGHVSALLNGARFRQSDTDQVHGHFFEPPGSELHVGHFATTEHYRSLDLETFVQELFCLNEAVIIVIFSRFGMKLDFLDLDDMLLGLRGLGFFRNFVLVLAEIHYSANRRLGGRRYFYQIQLSFPGLFHGDGNGKYTQLLSIGVDDTHLVCADMFVYADGFFGGTKKWSSLQSLPFH